MNTAPQSPPHFVLGFNLLIDRISIMRLMADVSAAIGKGAQRLTLCLSTAGGAPDQAIYAYEILRRLPIELTTHNVATVQSAGLVLFMAGAKRFAVPNATFLMHKTTHNTGVSVGEAHLSYGAESVRADDASAMAIVADRTGKDLKKVRTWFSGQKLRSTDFAKSENIIADVMPVEFPVRSSFFQVVGV